MLRFLKIITPVKCVIPLYDDYIRCPKEGELYQRVSMKSQVQAWSVNIDVIQHKKKLMQRGLRLLWDA